MSEHGIFQIHNGQIHKGKSLDLYMRDVLKKEVTKAHLLNYQASLANLLTDPPQWDAWKLLEAGHEIDVVTGWTTVDE